MSLDPEVRDAIDGLLRENRVVLFMKGNRAQPQCGFSAKTVEALDMILPDYQVVDVLRNPEVREGIVAAAFAILDRLGHDREPFGLLRQQFADCQRLSRKCPGLVGIGGLVILRFAGDGRTRDDHAVDTDRYGPGEATTGRARRGNRLGGAHGVHSAG